MLILLIHVLHECCVFHTMVCVQAYLKFLAKFFQQLSQSLEFFRDKMTLGTCCAGGGSNSLWTIFVHICALFFNVSLPILAIRFIGQICRNVIWSIFLLPLYCWHVVPACYRHSTHSLLPGVYQPLLAAIKPVLGDQPLNNHWSFWLIGEN